MLIGSGKQGPRSIFRRVQFKNPYTIGILGECLTSHGRIGGSERSSRSIPFELDYSHFEAGLATRSVFAAMGV